MMTRTANPMVSAREYNFDGIVGPTHNFAGLSAGNLASKSHAKQTSYPRRAALEGIAKMRTMIGLGLPQAVLPPHERPALPIIRQLGFTGSLADAVKELSKSDPWLLATVYSASAMWAANAATVSPSADTADGRVHLTPANLSSTLHRSFEGPFTERLLRTIFGSGDRFVVHSPLPSHPRFADEGAANHGRFAVSHGQQGVELFVFGREGGDPINHPGSSAGFPRRQTRLASETIIRSHGLDPARVQVLKQNGVAIDAGVFHNDVISVSNQMVLFSHQLAFGPGALDGLQAGGVEVVTVPTDQVSLNDAVSTYLFNSQLVTLPSTPPGSGSPASGSPGSGSSGLRRAAEPAGSMALIAPAETAENESVRTYLEELVAGPSLINVVHRVDVRQSMSNGGGPACLRLRVVLTDEEAASLGGSVLMDNAKLDQLEDWVNNHYREELSPADLADPMLIEETQRALDELTIILDLGQIYDFQRQ